MVSHIVATRVPKENLAHRFDGIVGRVDAAKNQLHDNAGGVFPNFGGCQYGKSTQ